MREDLRFLSDCSCVADCKTVEEVHEDNHDEKHKAEKEAVSKGSEVAVKIHGDIAELKLADEHRGRLDQRGPSLVEEDIVILSCRLVVHFVKENEEAEAEGNNEE